MGEDTRAADARRSQEPGLRARGVVARRAARDTREAGADRIGPFELNESQLQAWGNAIGRAVRTPIVIALRGDLGAGKSVLARAIARGAGIDAPMPSPTFNLLFRYETARGITVSHLDLYRLEDPAEVWELGWRELGAGNEIVLIEWPEHAESLLPPIRWDIRIEPGSTAETRLVTATPVEHDGVKPHTIPEPQL